MTNDNNHLHFLQEKINEIKSALFFSESNDVRKLPVSIVNILKIDDEGQIWFYINTSLECLDTLKNGFPVHLDFFKKGKPFFLKVGGKGIICESEIINDKTMKLVKMKMVTAEYFEKEPAKQKNIFSSMLTNMYNWLFAAHNNGMPYFFDEDMAAA